MRNHPKVLCLGSLWLSQQQQRKQQTATNNFVLDEKRIIKLATMMLLDCVVVVVVAVCVLFFSLCTSAGNGWFICRKHTKTHSHSHTVIKYKINISLTVCFSVHICLVIIRFHFRKLQQQRSWIEKRALYVCMFVYVRSFIRSFVCYEYILQFSTIKCYLAFVTS